MEKNLMEIILDNTLYENKMVFKYCEKCGKLLDIRMKECPECRLGWIRLKPYPELNAIDVGYSIIFMKDLIKEIKKGIVDHHINRIGKELDILITRDDADYIIDQLESYRNKNTEFNVEGFNQVLIKRLNIMSDKAIEVSEILNTGDSINRMYKPFILSCASFIELLFKDYIKELLKIRIGNDIGNRIITQYERKNINDFFDLYKTITDMRLSESLDNINKGFYDRWNTLRNDRNEIIHNNEIDMTFKKINNTFKIVQDSVKVFGTIKGRDCIKRS